MSNAATTLLALLDHTSADQLETLLEPVHLLIVLEGCGRDRETIQHAIDTGAVPGTLLLALFDEGRTAEELVAMLPDGALRKRRENQVVPFVYAGAAIMSPALFADAPAGEFSLTRMFDRANEQERLFGLRLDGVWMHVGTPDAVHAAEEAFLESVA